MSDRGTPGKPSSAEEEYFVREDAEKKRKLALQGKKDKQAEELKRLKELHWMHCPKCGMELTEIQYRGVQVDNCFSCGGMFLDVGEAEKILEFEEPGALGNMFNYLVGKK